MFCFSGGVSKDDSKGTRKMWSRFLLLTKTFYETEINPDLYNMLSTHSWVGVIRRNLFDNSLNENYDLWKNVKLQFLQFITKCF